MRPNFPPWLVEIVPELESIDDNPVWRILRHTDKPYWMDWSGPSASVGCLLLLNVIPIPFAGPGIVILMWWAWEYHTENDAGHGFKHFLTDAKDNHYDLAMLPLDPAEIGLGYWAWSLRRREFHAWRSGGIMAIAPVAVHAGIHGWSGLTMMISLILTFLICITLCVPGVRYNMTMDTLFRDASGRTGAINPEMHRRLRRVRERTRDTSHRSAISVPLTVGLIEFGLCLAFDTPLAWAAGAIVYLMFAVPFCLAKREECRERMRGGVRNDLRELGELIGVALASMRGERVLRGCSLAGAEFAEADLSYADCRQAVLPGARLMIADLRYANLSGAVLDGADLRGCDLTGADLRGARLAGANLDGARLDRALLGGANLVAAKNLTREQTASAVTDASTRLPEGFSISDRGFS